MNYGYGDSHRRQLIDDVKEPKASDYDDRLAKVKYQPIGTLDDNYFLRHVLNGRGWRSKSSDFTRIPPLDNLNALPEVIAPAAFPGSYLTSITKPLQNNWQSFGDWLARLRQNLAAKGGLPRKYTLSSGLQLDWHNPTLKRLRWLTPLLLLVIAGLVIGLIAPWSATQGHSNGNAKQSQSRASYSLVPLNLPTARHQKAASTSSANGSQTSNSSNKGSASSSATSNSKSAGSSASSPSSSGSTSASSRSAILPLSLPPQDISVGGKTIINTGSTTIN